MVAKHALAHKFANSYISYFVTFVADWTWWQCLL